VFKRLAQMSPSQAASRVSIESDAFVFHYLIEADVCYLTLTDRGYPKKLAYQYLEELQSEFSRLYGPQIEGIARPYAFIKFGAGRAACVLTFAPRRARVACRPLLPRGRHIYSEDEEAVPGHAHAAQHREAERGPERGALDHDAQYRGGAWAGRATGPCAPPQP